MKLSKGSLGGTAYALFAMVVAVFLLVPTGAQATDRSGAGQDAATATVAKENAKPIRNAIVGGGETTFEKHPWLVQITLNGQAFCGGALVHPRLVLTAAHCLYSAENGTWWGNLGQIQGFTSRTITQTGGEELMIDGWGIAENYQPLPGTGENDWGLIALSSPSSRPHLKIAGANERSLWKAGRSGTVAGFGHIQFGGPASQTLKEVSTPIISDAACGSQAAYDTNFRVANMLCAGIMKGGAGTCQGDSGGPLTVPVDGGGRRIVGVVSWGDNCAKPDKPTVYARVAEPGVSTQINALAADIGRQLAFPGLDANTNLLGSGGKPVGCAAANAASNKAAKKAAKLNKRVKNAKKRVKKAKKKARKKARKALKKSKKALKKARKASQTAGKKAKAACN